MANSAKRAEIVSAQDVARRFAAQTEAAIVDLEERFPAGISPVERALAERIRAALARLLECAAQLEKDGVIVLGSTGQPRQHQLIKAELDLRREIGEGLKTLADRAEQQALFEQARAITRGRGQTTTDPACGKAASGKP